MEEGTRENQGKLDWSLVDFKELEPMVKVLMFGAKKYGAHNWKKGLKVTETIESMLRHTFALLNGEDTDPESGEPHVGHIQGNAMFLAKMLNMEGMDDRYKEVKPTETPVVILLCIRRKSGFEQGHYYSTKTYCPFKKTITLVDENQKKRVLPENIVEKYFNYVCFDKPKHL